MQVSEFDWSCCKLTLKAMMRMLNTVFLRLYAFNLGRKFRNSSDAACNDALMQMGIVLIVPVAAVLVLVAAIVARNRAEIVRDRAAIAATILVVVLPIVYWVHKTFGHYRNTPEAARAFMSLRERVKSIVGFVSFPVISALLVGYVGHLLKS
jgi:hypothetical protein